MKKNLNDITDIERSNKQSDEEFLFETAAKSSNQILYDKALFDTFDKADEALKEYSLTERRRLNSEEAKDDDVMLYFFSYMQFTK